MMRNALLVAVLAVTAACGGYHLPVGQPTGTGAVSGHVVSIPCAPVEQAGHQCAGRPAAGVEIDFTTAGSTAKAVTESNGGYSIQLANATWLVHIKSYMRVISGPPQLTVAAGSAVRADYVLDSGIRVPVPQQ